MGLLEKVFSKQIQQAVTQQLGSLYNRNVYHWLNDGQPIYFDDKGVTYVNEGFMAAGAVYECVDLIIKKIAACPILIYEVKDQRKYQKYLNLLASDSIENKALALQIKSDALEEVQPEKIQRILDNPNSEQDQSQFIKQVAGYYLLLGNTFLYLNGPNPDKQQWNEMYTLPSQYMKIVSGGMFEPVRGYILQTMGTKDLEFPAHQVVHMKTFNPEYSTTGSQLYGMSPLRAYLRTLARVKAGDKEINKQLNNGGAFGILSPKNSQDVLTPEQKNALKDRLVLARNAKDDLERIVPGTVSMEWMQIGLPYADMKLLDTLQAADEDIYRAYHVPLQFRSTDSSTFNNQSVAGKQLIYNAVDPIADDISNALTKALCSPIKDKKYIIKIDTSSLPEMASDMKEVATWLKTSTWLTENEKREVMGWGKLEHENMDIPLVPKTLTRVDQLHLNEEGFSNAIDKIGE